MRQGSLFDITPSDHTYEAVGVIGLTASIRAEMNRVALEYDPGRKTLVDAINDVAKREGIAIAANNSKQITKDILDKWLQAGERGHAPSLEAIVCFCLATGDSSSIKPLLKLLKLTAVSSQDLDMLEYGKICATERELRNRKKKMEARI